MLEAITDFWKPVKKTSTDKLQPDQLQIGSAIGFGFVPQASLSGRRFEVTAINIYQFGDETLTSFVISQDKDPGMSMIVSGSEAEQYLHISRRIPINDRMKLFDSRDLENVMNKPDVTRLPCKDNIADYKGWVVASYKREIQGLKGRIFKGDYRKKPLPKENAQAFDYTLLLSESNEHAIEIEKYADGRIEVYATIYRRMNDVGEITHPATAPAEPTRNEIKLSAPQTAAPAQPMLSPPAAVSEPKQPEPKLAIEVKAVEPAKQEEPKPAIEVKAVEPAKQEEPKPAIEVKAVEPAKQEEARPAPIRLQELSPSAPSITSIKPPAAEPAKPEPARSLAPSTPQQESKPAMQHQDHTANGSAKDMSPAEANKSKLFVQPTAPESYMKQEVKTVSNRPVTNFDSDAIECDLRVANKIIDEAIRNEMRLTDIVRRIIELPVAYPESVQIPILLTDEDYALLAIRYGLAPSDRNAIKARIIEDLNDFSGNGAKKQLAA